MAATEHFGTVSLSVAAAVPLNDGEGFGLLYSGSVNPLDVVEELDRRAIQAFGL